MYAVNPRSTTTKEMSDMLLYLTNTLQRLKLDVPTFFRIAHLHTFRKDVDITCDVKEFEAHSFVPKYVQRYLTYIKEQES